MQLNNLSKDLLFNIGKHLDYPYLYNLCQTNKRLYEKLYLDECLWHYKLKKKFPQYMDAIGNKSKRRFFITLFRLSQLKDALSGFDGKGGSSLIKSFALCDLQSAEYITINNSTFEIIPKDISLLQHLKELLLYNNQISTIPKELFTLTNLQVLNLSNNMLQSIPKEIGNLHNLVELSLHNNQLKLIPKEIGMLCKLKRLYLGLNIILEIPKEIGMLHNLELLMLFNNCLTYLPIEINNLKKLNVLHVDANPIHNLHEINLLQTE